MSGYWMLDRNPPYPLILRLFLFFVTPLILLLSIRLLWDPFGASSWWPWEISPFDALFLGAFSLAELSAILVFLIDTRWAPGRLVVPSWFTFTALVGLLSMLNINLFDLQRQEVQIWFSMYLSAPLLAAYFFWRGWGKPPADARQLPAGWQRYLAFQSLITGLIGIILVFAPQALTACWPGRLEPFTARIFGVIFLTSAVGAYLLRKAAAPVEGLAYALPQAILGLGTVAAFLAVSDRFQPNYPNTNWILIWLFAYILFGAAGVLLMWKTAGRS